LLVIGLNLKIQSFGLEFLHSRRQPETTHAAKRIIERLRIEHSFLGGYTALRPRRMSSSPAVVLVKDYVRLAHTRSREVFVPLAHPPGHAAIAQ
jgi:hypothetical protein